MYLEVMCAHDQIGNAQATAALSQIDINTSSLFLELSIWFPYVLSPSFAISTVRKVELVSH